MNNIRNKIVKFISFIIEFSLQLETELHVNEFLLITFTTLGSLIPQAYSIIPIYIDSQNSNYYQIVAKIVRFNLLLPQSEYVYIVVFSIFVIIILLKYLIAYNINASYRLKFKFITFLNQIYDIWLINPIMELLMFSSTTLSVIIMLCYLFFLFFRLTITKAQLFLQQDNFNLTNTSFLIYIATLLNIAQILVFRNNDDLTGISTFYLQIIGLLINLCAIANIIFYSPILNYTISNLVLSIHFNSSIYNICALIMLGSNGVIDQLEIMTLLLLPLNFKIAQYYQLKQLLRTIVQQKNPYYVVNLILYLKQNFSYSKQRILIESIACKGDKRLQVEPLRFTAIQPDDLIDFYLKLSLKHQEVTLLLIQLSNNDLIAHLSLLLRLEFYFQAYICISKENSQKKYSFLNKIKFEICASKCREKLNYHMMTKNNIESRDADLNIKKFMEIETKNLELCKQIVKSCEQKIQYLKNFDYDEIDQLYANSNKLISDLETLLYYVKNLYNMYPSNRIQNVIAFIYAELFNDYLSANKTMSQAALQDDKIYKGHTNIKIDLYSSKTAYLIINLEDFKIVRNSNNVHDFFAVDTLILNDLVPSGIRDYHNNMIRNFIKTGKSKFFRNVQDGLFVHKGFIEGASMFTEIIFEQNQLHALMVLQVQEDNQIIMVVDNQHRIVGLSEEFFNIVGGKPDQIELIYEIPVEYVIPKFKLYKEDPQVQQLQIKFLTSDKIFDFVTLLIHYKQKRSIQELMDACWLDNQNYDIYITHCKIYNNNDNYYIVRFNYLKNSTQSQSMSRTITHKTLEQQLKTEIDYDEEIEMVLPYEDSEPKYINDIIIDRQIDQVDQHPDLLLSNRESRNHDGCALFDEQDTLNKHSFQFGNNSQNQLIQLQISKQQRYFQKEIHEERESNDVDDSQNVEIEGRSSQVSQLSGQKKAYYYKKYVLIEKMIQAPNSHQVQKVFLLIAILQSLVLISQATLSLVATTNTFNSYLTNIDLLQIKYYLFQPLESFIVTRYTIINYNAYYTAKTITATQLKSYLVFPNSNLNLGFDDVQNNLAEILNRLTLQDFLAEEYDIYIYTDTNAGALYKISMRQALSILVNYQYTFKAAYIYDGKTVSDSPYIFYSYRNLLTLYNSFDELNQDLYQQTILQVVSDEDKELKMFYPFVIILIALIGFQVFQFLKSQGKIASIIGLMAFNEVYTMQKDIERLTQLADEINKNNEHLFKYQFVLEKKESFLKLQQKQLQAETSIKRLEYKRKYLSNKKGFILISIQLILIFGFTLAKYNLNINYFIKFGPTAYFYQQITDLGTNIPTIYAMREVLYYRWRYPFYTTDDFAQILLQIQTCLEQVQNTTSYLQTLQTGNYLYSSDFFSNLSVLETSNICNFLSPDMLTKSLALCNITMAGSFLHGLTGALIYIYQSVFTAMQINEFTNKTVDTIDELEGAFIMSEIIKEFNTAMKSDLNSQTNNVLQTITVIFPHNYQIICILAFIYAIIQQLVIYFFIRPYLEKQYFKAKRFLYLIPQQTLFLDDTFERLARSVMQDLQIIA